MIVSNKNYLFDQKCKFYLLFRTQAVQELQSKKLPTAKTPIAAEQRRALFRSLDPNGNGHLSLAEVDKGLKDVWGEALFKHANPLLSELLMLPKMPVVPNEVQMRIILSRTSSAYCVATSANNSSSGPCSRKSIPRTTDACPWRNSKWRLEKLNTGVIKPSKRELTRMPH